MDSMKTEANQALQIPFLQSRNYKYLFDNGMTTTL